jgi:predicted dithiol-disulfide oxidoreductase (DUF899 family)
MMQRSVSGSFTNFTAPDRPLILYHFMFGKRQVEPCPMCSMWIDGFDAVAL